MADRQTLELRLQDAFDRYLEAAPTRVDAGAMATTAVESGRRTRGLDLRWQLPVFVRIALVAIALLLAIAIAILGGGTNKLFPNLTTASATPSSPTAAPTPTPIAAATIDSLAGGWLADIPGDLAFVGSAGVARMTLLLEANGLRAHVITPDSDLDKLASITDSPAPDEIRFVTTSPTPAILLAAKPAELAGCAVDDAGTYSFVRSKDGRFLTLAVLSDACPSREAMLGRSWVRTLGEVNGGGVGVVDAFDPLFEVELPAGSYSVNRIADWIEIGQPIPEFAFIAVKDPQGFLDPCDAAAGRYEIAPGADPVVDYFRQLDGFTVDSTSALQVDGHRAVELVLHANTGPTCASGWRLEWQPKVLEPTAQASVLRPGDIDTLFIVELPDSTVMLQILPTPGEVGAQVIASIKFLDGLPTGP